MPMICSRRLVLVCGALAACAEAPRDYRGNGLQVASLPAAEGAAVYRAALAGSFQLDDPTLSILADTTLLPRNDGLVGGDKLSANVLGAMRDAGFVKGTCKLPETRRREPLICEAPRPGYLVRFSAPFARHQDTVLVHIAVQQYATPLSPPQERLRFERAYQIARTGATWRAVREARLPQP
jgi:hypothetical protein